MILGVDPGFQGALAVYDPGKHRLVSVIDMPLLSGTKRPEIDTLALARWIASYSNEIVQTVIEDVTSQPGNAAQAMIRFGFGAGVIHGILSAHAVPVKTLKPSVWKMVLGLSPDKEKSLSMVRKLFPGDEPLFARKKDDGRAEAVLLAYLGGLMLKSSAR
jgi:hypothetical protein